MKLFLLSEYRVRQPSISGLSMFLPISWPGTVTGAPSFLASSSAVISISPIRHIQLSDLSHIPNTSSKMECSEDQRALPILEGALSEPDIRSDENAYEEEDELLLLQIADTNTPASPSLDTVMHKPTGACSAERPKAASPLLVERPQCSGIDVSAFSFAKPLQQGKRFSIQSSATRTLGQSRTQMPGHQVPGNEKHPSSSVEGRQDRLRY